MSHQIDVHILDADVAHVHKDVVEEGQDAFGCGVTLFFLLRKYPGEVEVSFGVSLQVQQGVAQLKAADSDTAGDGPEQPHIERQLAEVCDRVLRLVPEQRILDNDPVEEGVINVADLYAAVEIVGDAGSDCVADAALHAGQLQGHHRHHRQQGEKEQQPQQYFTQYFHQSNKDKVLI